MQFENFSKIKVDRQFPVFSRSILKTFLISKEGGVTNKYNKSLFNLFFYLSESTQGGSQIFKIEDHGE